MKAGLLLSLLVSVIAFSFVSISSPKAEEAPIIRYATTNIPPDRTPRAITSPSVEGNQIGQPRPALPKYFVFCKALINIGVAHGRPSQKYMHMMLYRPHP